VSRNEAKEAVSVIYPTSRNLISKVWIVNGQLILNIPENDIKDLVSVILLFWNKLFLIGVKEKIGE
jgi:hypothetical protein